MFFKLKTSSLEQKSTQNHKDVYASSDMYDLFEKMANDSGVCMILNKV